MKIINKENLQKLALKAQGPIIRQVVRLPKPILRKVTGKPISIDGQTFDLSLQVMLKLFHATQPISKRRRNPSRDGQAKPLAISA